MKKLLLIIALFSYKCEAQIDTSKKQIIEITNTGKPDFNVALKFINDYVKHLENPKAPSTKTWIKLNTLLTPNFKNKYKAFASIDADPIIDAQDYPEKGFVIEKTDPLQGYVTVSGVGEWATFKVILKLVKLNKKWLVDGSGIINIPKSKQIKH